jgi:hypothetical protein
MPFIEIVPAIEFLQFHIRRPGIAIDKTAMPASDDIDTVLCAP